MELVAIVVIGAIIVFVAPLLISAEDVRNKLFAEIEAATGYRLRVSGPVHISVVPSLDLVVMSRVGLVCGIRPFELLRRPLTTASSATAMPQGRLDRFHPRRSGAGLSLLSGLGLTSPGRSRARLLGRKDFSRWLMQGYDPAFSSRRFGGGIGRLAADLNDS